MRLVRRAIGGTIAVLAISTLFVGPQPASARGKDGGMTPWETFVYLCELENGKPRREPGAFICVYPNGDVVFCTPDMTSCARKEPKPTKPVFSAPGNGALAPSP